MDLNEIKQAVKAIGSEIDEIREAQKQIKASSNSTKILVDQSHSMVKPGITSNNNQQMDIEIGRLSQQIEELHIKFRLISDMITKFELGLDNLEQYSRRNCLILHGINIQNLPNCHDNYSKFLEVLLSIINQRLGLHLSKNVIDIALPLPKARNGKVPIIIKFLRRSDRNNIFRKKKMLAGSGLALTESLTKMRLALFTETQSFIGKDKVWTFNGTVYCEINSKREAIHSQLDLYRLVESHPEQSDPSAISKPQDQGNSHC